MVLMYVLIVQVWRPDIKRCLVADQFSRIRRSSEHLLTRVQLVGRLRLFPATYEAEGWQSCYGLTGC